MSDLLKAIKEYEHRGELAPMVLYEALEEEKKGVVK